MHAKPIDRGRLQLRNRYMPITMRRKRDAGAPPAKADWRCAMVLIFGTTSIVSREDKAPINAAPSMARKAKRASRASSIHAERLWQGNRGPPVPTAQAG